MVCHCSVPDVFPQPSTRVLDPAIPSRPPAPPHPAEAMRPPQRRQLALEALADAETVNGSPHPHWLEMLGHTRFSRH